MRSILAGLTAGAVSLFFLNVPIQPLVQPTKAAPAAKPVLLTPPTVSLEDALSQNLPELADSVGPTGTTSGRWYATDPSQSLEQDLASMAQQSGASVAVTLIDLGGNSPVSWSYGGDDQFTAASTYKLVVLAFDGQLIAEGQRSPESQVCYQDSDWEDGPYGDYADGACYSIQQLAMRVAKQSDNTAAHMLVRDEGGQDALNAFARSAGASNSELFDPNVTTSNDLARVLAAEARGQLGGQAAENWLYPLLSHTDYEDGLPAGVPSNVTVVHKVGWIGDSEHDAGLFLGGPAGSYVLVVMTEGGGGWDLAQQMSARTYEYEQQRWTN